MLQDINDKTAEIYARKELNESLKEDTVALKKDCEDLGHWLIAKIQEIDDAREEENFEWTKKVEDAKRSEAKQIEIASDCQVKFEKVTRENLDLVDENKALEKQVALTFSINSTWAQGGGPGLNAWLERLEKSWQ